MQVTSSALVMTDRKPLPRWVTANAASLQREAADYIDKTHSERAEMVDILCRDAALLLQMRSADECERALLYRDPLPASSVAVLARLRDAYRKAKRAEAPRRA